MLPKVNRLAHPFLSAAKSFRTKHFLIKYKEQKDTPSQFAVVIAKKRVPHAVDRNKLKREIMGCVKEHLSSLTKQGHFVFILQSSPPEEKETQQEITIFFKEIGILSI